MKLLIDDHPYTLTFRYDHVIRDRKTDQLIDCASNFATATVLAGLYCKENVCRYPLIRQRARAILLKYNPETNSLTEYCIGESECSTKDTFNRPVGRLLAFQRLLANLDLQFPTRTEDALKRRAALTEIFQTYCTRPIHDTGKSLARPNAPNPKKAYKRGMKRHTELVQKLRELEEQIEGYAEAVRAERESQRPSRREMLELLQSLGVGR